ncbi:MAG: DNA replication/repair protein RecF [bacterium]
MLTLLHVEHFRNLAPLTWSPGPGRHLLLGGNGAGKTSLLEAVYAVATTRSFRTPRLAECVHHGSASFRLGAEVEDRARATLAVAYGPGGLERSVNGARGSLAEHLGVLPVVAWTSADVEVVTGPPGLRRRFLDRGVVSLRPGALATLRRYRDALSEKRQLLARRGGGFESGAGPALPEPDTLGTWNRVLAPAAVEVAGLRRAYAERLGRRLREVLEETGLPFPQVALAYRPSPEAALGEPEALAERLDRASRAELRRGIPLLGPHRDDLEILWGGHPVARVASAGERKALSIALVAAHGRVLEAAGRAPAYLLDDLDAELAPETLAAVWRLFPGTRQLVATSNRPAVWEGLEAEHRSRLVAGALREG